MSEKQNIIKNELTAVNPCDLHVHTTHSDASRTVAQVIEYAAMIGLKYIAITDHDTMAGVDEAVELGGKLGVHVVPGVEMSTLDEESGRNVVVSYPSGCGTKYTCSYSKDGSNFVNVTANTAINFTDNGVVVAKVSDGTNEVTSSYTFKLKINNYITDKLYAFYDGHDNTKTGHSAATTSWYNKALDLNPSSASKSSLTFNGYTVPDWTTDLGLVFDGIDDYLDSGINQSELGQDMTISAVAMPTDLSPWRGLWGYHYGPPSYLGLTAQATSSGGLGLIVYQNNNTSVSAELAKEQVLDKVINVAVTYKGGNHFALYLNGQLVSKINTSQQFQPLTSSSLFIGKSYPDSNRYFKGRIYNFMVYQKALTEDEIMLNYKVNKNRYNIS